MVPKCCIPQKPGFLKRLPASARWQNRWCHACRDSAWWAKRTITPEGYLEDCLFSPDGKLLAAGGTIYDADTGRTVQRLGHDGVVQVAAFSSDGRLFVCIVLDWRDCRDRWHLGLWDARTGQKIRSLPGEIQMRSHAGFSADGKLVAAGLGTRDVGLWEVGTGRPVRVLTGRLSRVKRVAWNPDGSSLAMLTEDGPPVMCDLRAGTVQLLIGESEPQSDAMAFGPDGGYLAVGVGNEIELRDARTRRLLRTLAGHTKPVISLAFSRDGHILASGSWDTTTRLWDVATGPLVNVLPGEQPNAQVEPMLRSPRLEDWRSDFALATSSSLYGAQFVTSGTTAGVVDIAFSPDGGMIATAAIHYWALWDTASGRKLRALRPGFGTLAIAFSPDGSTVVSGMWDGTLKLWRADSGQLLGQSKDHEGGVKQLAFSPSDGVLASCAEDPVVKLRRVPGGKVARILTGHTWSVNSVAFSPSGRLLPSGSSDGTVRVWDVAMGKSLLTLYIFDQGRNWLALASRGEYDCSVGADSSLAWRLGDEVFASRELAVQFRRRGLVAQVGVNGPPSPSVGR
jgi:WD40 repeat protein